MKQAPWLAGLVVALASGQMASAQALIFPMGSSFVDVRFIRGLTFTPAHKYRDATGVVWGSPRWAGTTISSWGPAPISRVTYFSFGAPVLLAPVPVFRVPAYHIDQLLDDLQIRPLPPRQPPVLDPRGMAGAAPPPLPMPPMAPAERQPPVQPAQPARQPPPAPAPPAPREPAPRREPAPLPDFPQPEGNPRAESGRQIRLGREAFAAREYARAERRFQEAADVLPTEPLAFFLLAQAQFTLGKYQEAVQSIESGLTLQPDWPAAFFPARELYAANSADFDEHLRRLRDALARHPADPYLLFLHGYELWFDNQREEARTIFQRAKNLPAVQPLVARFTRVPPLLPMLM
jgi:Flp pilus assembly protein TadD